MTEKGRGPYRMKKSTSERFWDKVVKGASCWGWAGAVSTRGYAAFASQFSIRANRYSFWLHNGPIPEGMEVCHTCDNRLCCNPSHLFLGTHAENMRDAARKGRTVRGSRIYAAKLQESDIPKIVAMRRDGALLREIAGRFGVAVPTIRGVVSGATWRHVPRG